jgi:hypothetical protein
MNFYYEWEATKRHEQLVRDAARRNRWSLDRVPTSSAFWKTLAGLFAPSRDLPEGQVVVYSDGVPPKPVRKAS